MRGASHADALHYAQVLVIEYRFSVQWPILNIRYLRGDGGGLRLRSSHGIRLLALVLALSTPAHLILK